MRHIALVIPTLGRVGGAERQFLLLALGLVNRGWQVDVVTLSGNGGEAAGHLAQAGAGFLSLRMRKGLLDPRGWLTLVRWLRKHSPDIVHAHLPHAAWLCRWSRIFVPLRVELDTIHSPATGGWGRRLSYQMNCSLPDMVTAVSGCVADAYLAAQMVVRTRLMVVPNGIDCDSWRPCPEARQQFRREIEVGDDFLWLAVGRLERVKDFATLIRAMADVPNGARLVIAGGGAQESELRSLARELGVEARVSWLGFEVDVLRWMQAADGFVLPSLWEGLSMSLLEACVCEVPVVVSDVPGNREIVEDRWNGLLARVSDSRSLAGEMTGMMKMSAEERKAMGRNARRRVLERYELNSVLDRWETLYKDLLEMRPEPARIGKMF